jgi:UDP-N-acetylmuramate dehydrogenase
MPIESGFKNIVRCGELMAMHTWFQLGGPAEYFAEPETPDQLVALIKRCHEEGLKVRILGRGSNVLVRDEGVKGMVVHLSSPAFCGIRFEERSVIAGGGALLGQVVTSSVNHGLAGLETLIGIPGTVGLETLIGIPGTVGGALHGNAGTRTGGIGQWTIQATVLSATGEFLERQADDLAFGYRESNLDELAILEARCQLEEDDPRELAKRMQKHWILKKASQPLGSQSAGCVFKNPRSASAGELIDQAGLKGTRIGGAVVSDRHANFIIVEPQCTSEDVLRLIDLVRNQILERLGEELELELEVW